MHRSPTASTSGRETTGCSGRPMQHQTLLGHRSHALLPQHICGRQLAKRVCRAAAEAGVELKVGHSCNANKVLIHLYHLLYSCSLFGVVIKPQQWSTWQVLRSCMWLAVTDDSLSL